MRGCNAFIYNKGRVLLILRDNRPDIPNPNTWSLPGGGIEEGETPDEGIRRECMEEIGIIPAGLKLVGKGSEEDVFGYVAELTDEEVSKVKLGNEGQKLEFFRMSEVNQLKLSPYMNHLIRTYGSAIQKILDGEHIEPEEVGLHPI